MIKLDKSWLPVGLGHGHDLHFSSGAAPDRHAWSRQLSYSEMDNSENLTGISGSNSVRCGFFFVPDPNKRQNIHILPLNY